MNHQTLVAACAAFLVPLASAQQDAADTAFPLEFRVPIHAAPDPDGHEALWTGGADWKASFQDGLRFLPRASRAQDPAAPFHWRTSALRVGGERLELSREAEATPRGAFRCEIDHGVMIEAYDVLATGLEQSFVLPSPIAKDLVIAGAIAGAYTASPRGQEHAALEFVPLDATARAGASRVRYGAAVAIDARGKRLPLASSFDGAEIALHVPGDWLATAAYPVVVDPLLSPILLDASSAPITAVRLGRDPTRSTANLAVAVSRRFASTDDDVFCYLASPDLSSRSLVFSRITTASELEPALAFQASVDRFVFAWSRAVSATNTEQVQLHVHPGGSLSFLADAVTLPSPAGRQRRPAVGGLGFAGLHTHDEVLIAREVEPANTSGETNATRIWCGVYDPLAGLVSDVEIGPAYDSARPSVTHDSANHSWLVAWQWRPTFGDARWNVGATRVTKTGQTTGLLFQPDTSAQPHHLSLPVVAGIHGHFCLAYAVSSDAQGGITAATDRGESVRVQTFDWPQSSSGPQALAPSVSGLAASGGRFVRPEALAMDESTGSHWALTQSIDSALGRFLRFSLLSWRGVACAQHELGLNGGLPCGLAFDADEQRFAMVYGQSVPVGSAVEHRTYGRLFVPAVPEAPVLYGTACLPGVLSLGTQPFRVGNRFPGLSLSLARPSMPAWLFLSLGAADLPLDGFGFSGCRLLVDLTSPNHIAAIGFTTGASGDVQVRFTLPETLAPFDLHTQWVHANPDAPGGLRTTQAARIAVR